MFIQLVQRLISNYNASNTYAFTPAGPSVGALGLSKRYGKRNFHIYGGYLEETALVLHWPQLIFVIASHYKYGLGRGQ
jgi:hypothetical protein